MIKNCLFAVALLSLALAGGCAKGGNGTGSGITVKVSDGDVAAVGATLSVTFTATVTGTTNTAVNWTLSGTACTGTPNPCGTLTPTTGTTPATATYQAPATAPSPSAVTITATSQADTTAQSEMTVNVIQVTVVVTPTAVTVGQNLVQQFTAVAVPDAAPQTFTWNVTCTSGTCGTVQQDSKTSGLAVYTAPSSSASGVQVTATSTVPQVPATDGVGTAKVTVAASRLAADTYAFRFSGYDGSNHPVAVAGSLTVTSKGAITGVEAVAGLSTPYTITSGSYTPSPNSSNNISNNLGTLTLNLSNSTTNIYTAVLTSSGIIRMIESSADGTGITGSGVMQKSGTFNLNTQTFVFGFTGVDSTGNRVGYVGMLPMTPGSNNIGGITGGLLDVNGTTVNGCGTSSCNVGGSYSPDPNISGLWHMTLTTAQTQEFDFFVSAGTAQTKTAANPLTLYAISTDPVDATHPALSGSMVYQVPLTYNNATFAGTSVSNLTGASANVSLTVGTTDGASSGTGGTGGFTGGFDQNNNGTIVSVEPTPSNTNIQFTYTYVATSGTNGRYIFQMLGNPIATPVVPPLPFILYASGANRGFLLDQSSSSVMTGTMDPQLTPNGFSYTFSELADIFAAATISNSDSSIAPVVQNLLLTSTGNATYNVAGTENPGNVTLTGTYRIANNTQGPGTGTITLTAPAANYVIYAIDASAITGSTNDVITDFMMMGTCTPQPPQTSCSSGPPSSIIFVQQ